MRILKSVFIVAFFLSIVGCSITPSNDIGDTSEGRAQIANFVTPGETQLSQVKAQFGNPVATQGLGDGNFQANYSSYFGNSGYVALKYNDATDVIFAVESYSFDAASQKFVLESRKP